MIGPVTLESGYAVYGTDVNGQDANVGQMIVEAIQKAVATEEISDWSVFDNDKDGLVDAVYVIYAGEGQHALPMQTDLIWPHTFQIENRGLELPEADGVKFNNAFTPASVCGPARTSLFTGQMPSNHELMRNSEKGGEGDPKLDNPNIITEMEDYANYLIGKWHVGKTVLPRDFGFRGHNLMDMDIQEVEYIKIWYLLKDQNRSQDIESG